MIETTVTDVEAGQSPEPRPESDGPVRVSVTTTESPEPAETGAEMTTETNGPLEVSTSVGEVERLLNWSLLANVAVLVGAIAVVWRGVR